MLNVSWIILHRQRQGNRTRKEGNIYHRKALSLSKMDGFLLLRKISSFFPSSVRPARKKKTKFSINCCSFVMWEHFCNRQPLTVWMLQPVTIHVIQIAAFKLLIIVLWNWDWHKWVHLIKSHLKYNVKTLFICHTAYNNNLNSFLSVDKTKESIYSMEVFLGLLK